MPNDSVIKVIQPGAFDDQLTEVLRHGARALLAQAVEARSPAFLASTAISRPRMAASASSVTASMAGAVQPVQDWSE